MLQKDGNPINKGFKKEFAEEFESLDKKSTTVIFRLVSSIYDGKTRVPRSYSIPSEVTVFEGGGDSSEYVYYKTKKDKVVGGVMQTIYEPSIVTFGSRGEIMLDVEREADLFIFLMKHSRRALAANGDGVRKPIFYLVDKTKEAKEKVAKKQAVIQMQKYLYDPESRLKDEDLLTIARALRVPNIDAETDIAFIQTSIEDKVKRNPQLFLDMKEVGDEVQMRANLQLAIEANILFLNTRTFRWELKDTDSGKKADLAVVRKNEDAMARLVYWLKHTDDNDHYGKVMELLTGSPVERKEAAPQVDSDIDKQLELEKLKQKNLQQEKENLDRAEALKNGATTEEASPEATEEAVEEEETVIEDDETQTPPPSGLPVLEDMELEDIKEQFAKPHGVRFSHLTTKEKIIENLLIKVPEEERDFDTRQPAEA